jgi:hypothetical protein
MPYFLVDLADLPYPNGMGERPPEDGTASNCPLEVQRLIHTFGRLPGQDGYRTLFSDTAIAERRNACHVHTGDWAEVLPVVTAFLEPFTADADPAVIRLASSEDSRITGLGTDDRILAQALLNTVDPIRVYVTNGRLLSVGQHRICSARTAGVAAVPVWFDATTARPPRSAALLQRGSRHL